MAYKVIRKDVRWNRKTYHEGEYLPEAFTEKDMYRVLYPSHIAKVDKPEEVKVPMGVKIAESVPVAPVKPTGAPLSGAKVINKK